MFLPVPVRFLMCCAALIAGAVAAGAQPQQRVITSASIDLNGDGVTDHVELRESSKAGFMDLAVWLSANGGRLPQAPTLSKSAFGSGDAYELEVDRAGTVDVDVFTLMGRYKSSTTITIGVIDGTLTVVRYKVAVADSATPPPAPPEGRTCDADYRSNKALRNGQPVMPPGPAVSLAAWTERSIPAACRQLF